MIRNPFMKEDKGGTCVCFISIFIIIQIVFYFFFIDLIYVKDYAAVLKEVAAERGHKYYEKRKMYIPEITDKNLLQTDNFINDSGLWVIAVLFYLSSIFWLISYLKLLFTDI